MDSPAAPGLSLRGVGMSASEPDGTRTKYITRLDAVEIVESPRRDGRFLKSFTPWRPEDLTPVRVRFPECSIEVPG